MKKRILALGMAIVLLLSFTGCGSNSGSNAESTTAPTATAAATDSNAADTSGAGMLMNDGVLTIGVEIGYPPFEDYAEDGTTPIGYDIDFAYALAEKLGVEVNFINTAWDGIFQGIGVNYDCVISAVTIKPDRAETMLFSEPYIDNYQAVVVTAGSDLTVTSFNDLSGKAIALQKETTSDALMSDYVATNSIDLTISANEKITSCFTQLQNGEVDAVVCDSTVADGYVASNPDAFVIAYVDQSEPEQFGVAMSLDNTELKAAIDSAIEALKAEGFFEDNIAYWFGASEDAGTEGASMLMNDGVLTIGVEVGYPPFEDYAEDGTTEIGYDIDFAYALAEKLGVEVNFINTAWDGIFQGIGVNYDCVISAVTINDERSQTMLFSEPYIDNYQAVVVKAGSDLTVSSFNDLNGKAIALQKETTSDALMSDYVATGSVDMTISANEKITSCFTQLENGEVDAVVCDSTVADGYVASNPDAFVIAYVDQSEPEQFGVAMSLDNTELKAAIDSAIEELKAEGFFADNIAYWFGASE